MTAFAQLLLFGPVSRCRLRRRLSGMVDSAFVSIETLKMRYGQPNGSAQTRVKAAIAILLLTMAAPVQADILPLPQKLVENFGFTCLMLSEHTPATPLLVNIRYEPILEKNSFYRTAYWWTIAGKNDRFPSNNTFMNMRSLESDEPTSALSFQTADGWNYTYGLYYRVEERFPSFVYVPDHLVVRRSRAGASSSAVQLIGIGECRLNPVKPT